MSFHEENILKAIESIFLQFYQNSSPKSLSIKRGSRQLRSSSPVQSIAKELLDEAITSGLPLTRFDVEDQPLSGGNTAMSVSKITLHAPFVLKVDDKPKTANEGKTIRAFRETTTHPQEFRQCWPIVYAVREQYPYAYLMEYFPKEDGWISYEDRLYPPGTAAVEEAEAVRQINICLDILFGAYKSSINARAKPNLDEDYVGRICERLDKVAKGDARFASQPLTVNGLSLKPWQEYLDLIATRPDAIAKITPPFSTVCLGDPNPGNIVLRSGVSTVEVKFIDPKEWGTGDYLFDIQKITHFIEATGPIEKPADGKPRLATFKQGSGAATLDYAINPPPWTAPVVKACLARTRAFANQHNDPHWEARYDLGMAANLLGLPKARLDKKRVDSALILYGEGLRWLDTFCQRLTGGTL